MGLMERLVYSRRWWFARELALLLANLDVPDGRAVIGADLVLQHRGQGVIITPHTRIGDRVMIYQQVTIGRATVDGTDVDNGFEGVEICDDAVLCAGAKILGREGTLVVGRGTVVGANAVLTESTGEWEIWAGSPARKVGERGRGLVPPALRDVYATRAG